ncbi:unnamed protein product [Leptidea sinapis]|uniref:Uncharacterized protein n=1 Tax=Leptidea sinapis TaxID=189913 RepID=A0A5E4QJ56_9NEOP|nr:unnamed protein product [Leptidea sinapis]
MATTMTTAFIFVLIPDAFSESCRRCNAKQKHMGNVFFENLKKYPEYYDEIVKKYDPSGIYTDKLLEAFKGY